MDSFPAESPATGRNARALVTAALADWRLLPVLDDAVTCTAELIANVKQHAVRPVVGGVAERRLSLAVRCRKYEALFVEVGDDDPRMPTMPTPAGDAGRFAVNGRGLLIVSRLADELTWRRAVPGGKVVSCGFRLARYGVRQG